MVVPVAAILEAPARDWHDEVVGQAVRARSAASGVSNRVRIDLLEVALPARPPDATALRGTVQRLLKLAGGAYLEVPVEADLDLSLDVLAGSGGGAKLRCGGPGPEQVPTAAAVAAFFIGCAERGLRAKATAGLHRPLRAFDENLNLTVHGFLNLLVGAVLALERAGPEEVEAAVAEENPDAIALGPSSLRWRDRRFGTAAIARTRRVLFVGLGSCSVDEPAEHPSAWTCWRYERERLDELVG